VKKAKGFYIVACEIEDMDKEKKPKLGPKEVKLLAYLTIHGGEMWKEEILNRFAHSSKYAYILNRRLFRLQQKGFVLIAVEKNPVTGRQKQKVYLLEKFFSGK